VAKVKSCTPAQIALAWVLGRGEHVMTIPGTTKLENLKDNLAAYEIRLSDDEQATLDQLADRVIGDRYDERGMSIINA
jgi:aryl-alcohol dehydrogenase-like predicted oxidoreductase